MPNTFCASPESRPPPPERFPEVWTRLALDSKHGDLILFPTNDLRNRDLLLALLDGVKGSSEGVLDAALAHCVGSPRRLVAPVRWTRPARLAGMRRNALHVNEGTRIRVDR